MKNKEELDWYRPLPHDIDKYPWQIYFPMPNNFLLKDITIKSNNNGWFEVVAHEVKNLNLLKEIVSSIDYQADSLSCTHTDYFKVIVSEEPLLILLSKLEQNKFISKIILEELQAPTDSNNSTLRLKPERLEIIKVANETHNSSCVDKTSDVEIEKSKEVDAQLKNFILSLVNSSSIEEMQSRFVSEINNFPKKALDRICSITHGVLVYKLPLDSISISNPNPKELERLIKLSNNFKNLIPIFNKFEIKTSNLLFDLVEVINDTDKKLNEMISNRSKFDGIQASSMEKNYSVEKEPNKYYFFSDFKGRKHKIEKSLILDPLKINALGPVCSPGYIPLTVLSRTEFKIGFFSDALKSDLQLTSDDNLEVSQDKSDFNIWS